MAACRWSLSGQTIHAGYGVNPCPHYGTSLYYDNSNTCGGFRRVKLTQTKHLPDEQSTWP
jgi:hypothetical protein